MFRDIIDLLIAYQPTIHVIVIFILFKYGGFLLHGGVVP